MRRSGLIVAMESDSVDVAVIGAGVVGAAVAAAFARRRSSVAILERAARPASGVTSRNSGVIHSGIYYPPGSLKTRACVRGNELLVEWARSRGVPHSMVGKLVIARTPGEIDALERLAKNALDAGARGTRLLTGREVLSLEPSLPECASALFCERTGIIDPHALTLSLLRDAEEHGAWLATHASVTAIEPIREGFRIETARGALESASVVNAAGLFADEVAALVGVNDVRIHACRGDYFRLASAHRHRHLLYPVRDPADPGLGVHLTLDLAGGCRLGPDAEYVESKEDLRPADHKRARFAAAASRLLGPIDESALAYDGCGLRPKLRSPSETEDRDFLLMEGPPRCLHLLGIESPGLTASLALAEEAVAWLS